MARLTRDAFLGPGRPELPSEEVHLPVLGGFVVCRTMTVGEFDAFIERHRKDPGHNFRARLFVACACDDERQLLFTTADEAALAALPTSALEPAIAVILRLNGMSEEAREEIRKNSTSGTETGSAAASPTE